MSLSLSSSFSVCSSPPLLQSLVATVCDAFTRGVVPLLIHDCTGGSYFLRSKSHHLIAVFKPSDEEPYASNTPKPSKTLGPMRPGVPIGEMAIREVMAYYLDQEHFAGIPLTVLATAMHANFHSKNIKLGSCQVYCPHDCSADDLGPSQFDINHVHAIALLDLRSVNQDRHGGNILVQRSKGNRLIPIDHGCILPEFDAMSETQFTWLSWPQAREPLTPSTIAYVNRLNSSHQLQAMKQTYPEVAFPAKAIVTLHLGTIFVQTCVAFGLTIYDMGILMVRENHLIQSRFERLVEKALVGKDPLTKLNDFLKSFEMALEMMLRQEFPEHYKQKRIVRNGTHGKPRKTSLQVLLSTAA
ncbi:phosphatidylinositol kinase (PIK-E3) [Thraustotheca clavata]|uniref:Phosphatidylinositol kinase (PIK-E3) n=1 Tax=Thraustotheca clavata TaxID=74557 RepID=A0A1V9ZMV7_9STRA|nr:phosphatidylinositol kinase (PIK-E3) [Thraustotheca clavata]